MGESDWQVVRTDEHPVLDEKDLEICRLREALERLASPEAFVMSRATDAEDRARMEFAEKTLEKK